MDEANDDMEMKEHSEQEAGEQEGEDETTFDDDSRHGDESILIIDGSNPIFTRPDVEDTPERPEGSVPNAGRDAGVMKRYMIHDKKQFLRDGLGITVNKGDGPSSTTLYDELRTTTGKNGKINGAMYKGKKILILKNGKMEYSTDRSKARYVNEFKELLKKAYGEHQKTPAALVERHVGVDIPQEVMNNISDKISDRIESEIDDVVEDFATNTEITNNELRELRGILNVKGSSGAGKIEALKLESEHWKKEADKAGNEGNDMKSKLYEAIAKVADLKIDEIRLGLNQIPESEEVRSMIEEEAEVNDLTRFEKFRKWARENLLELSAVPISVAGILTTVIMAGRNTLKRGAQAVSKFGKVVANLAKKFGPILSALGTLVSKVLTLGAQGILFLAQNLWILVLALTYFIYNEYVRRRGSRTAKRRE